MEKPGAAPAEEAGDLPEPAQSALELDFALRHLPEREGMAVRVLEPRAARLAPVLARRPDYWTFNPSLMDGKEGEETDDVHGAPRPHPWKSLSLEPSRHVQALLWLLHQARARDPHAEAEAGFPAQHAEPSAAVAEGVSSE
jgi:hypothetical protein